MKNSDIKQSIKSNLAFSQLNDNDISRITESAQISTLKKGTIIYKEKSAADNIFILLSGTIDIAKTEKLLVINTETGNKTYGIDGAIDQTVRNASIVAHSDVIGIFLPIEFLCEFKLSNSKSLLEQLKENRAQIAMHALQSTSSKALAIQKEKLKQTQLLLLSICIILTYLFILDILEYFINNAYKNASFIGIGIVTIISSAFVLFSAGVPLLWIKKVQKESLRQYGVYFRGCWPAIRFMLYSTTILILLVTLTKYILLQTNYSSSNLSVIDIWTSSPGNYWSTILFVVIYSLFVPGQEFVVRSVLQDSLQHIFSGPYKIIMAILLSNLIFSCMHMHLGYSFVLISFIAGLYWGWLYYQTHSLVAVTLSHILLGVWATTFLNFSTLLVK